MITLKETSRSVVPMSSDTGAAKLAGAQKKRARARSSAAPAGPSPFDHWDQIAAQLHAAAQIRLFLDFDGTLVPYRPSPDRVNLSPRTQNALCALTRHSVVQVAIISGRRRASLAHFVKVPGIDLLGLYGAEKIAGGMSVPPRTMAALGRARTLLDKLTRQLPGIYIEDKGVSLAIHFRGAPESSRHTVLDRLRAAAPQLRPELHFLRSNSAWEAIPSRMRGKGHALRDFLKDDHSSYLPIYIGDDRTDEPAFAVMRHGITVRVGPARSTKAQFRLAGPRDVCNFLERLEAELP